jgi:cytochrome b6-f complex iron-sulfur subunit
MDTITNEKMDRVSFLKNLGLGGAAIFATVFCAGGLSSCSDSDSDPAPSNPMAKDLVLDLSTPAYSKLKTKGEYVIVDKVVIANTNEGKYVAVTLVCSHAGQLGITYRVDKFQCSVHGAQFDNNGKGLNENGAGGLRVYKTSLSGDKLTVTV